MRGVRIELGEIEASLRRHHDVVDAAVVVRSYAANDDRLLGYVVPRLGQKRLDELLQTLRATLPESMVPSALVSLDTWPVTASGKIDRASLPAPSASTRPFGYEPPRSPLEEMLCAIWAEALAQPRIGVHDDFFALGGHSLLAVQIFDRIARACGRTLPVSVLFRSRTIRLLAREIAEVKERNRACMVEIQPLGKGTPLVVLHGLGGEVLYWSRVARHLPRDQIILGFQPPFVNGAFHAFADLPSMAARYVRELSELRLGEAVVLAGFCSGAAIAFEMARQLAAEGRPVTRVVMIEPSPARHRPLSASTFLRALPAVMANVPRWIQIELLRCDRTERRQFLERSFALSWRRLRASLRPSDAAVARGAFEEFLALDSLPEDQRAMKEAHYAALEAFAPEPYGGAVTVVRARVNELFTLPNPMLGWDEVATHATLEVVEGSHLRLFSEPYVEPLARRLTDLLERPTLARSPRTWR